MDWADYPTLRALLGWLLGAHPTELRRPGARRAVDEAIRCGFEPLLHDYLDHYGRDPDPGEDSRSRKKLAWFALLRHQIRTLSDDPPAPWILLKGEPLGQRLYGETGLRPSTDIDVLVAREDVSDWVEYARSLGYEPEVDRPPRLLENNQYPLADRQSGALLELHWRLALPRIPSPEFEQCWRHTRVDETPGVEVRVFDDTFQYLQAGYHLHHHFGFLKGMVDFAAMHDVFGTEVRRRASDIAGDLGVGGLLGWGAVVGWLLAPGGPVPEASGWAWSWSLAWLAAAKGALTRDRPLRQDGLLGFKARDEHRGARAFWGLAGLGLLDHPRTRLDAALDQLFLGPDAMAARQGRDRPTAATWRASALRPFRLAAKQLSDIT